MDAYKAARRAERRRVDDIKDRHRERTDGRVREALGRYFPQGTPSGFVVALQRASLPLIEEIGKLEKVTKELHDGINKISDEASQRWVNGFNECEAQVRRKALELGLPAEQIEALFGGRGTVDVLPVD